MISTNPLIYMDPPYQGVCRERDPRYLKGVLVEEFVEVLESLNERDIKFLVNYDGRTGERSHGRKLPDRLGLHLVELCAGRSSQATLLGRSEITVESLYVSPALADSLHLRALCQLDRIKETRNLSRVLLGLPGQLFPCGDARSATD